MRFCSHPRHVGIAERNTKLSYTVRRLQQLRDRRVMKLVRILDKALENAAPQVGEAQTNSKQ